MQVIFVVALIGLAGGIAVGLQAPVANMISQRLGILESVFILHLGSAFIAGALLVTANGGKLSAWRTLPWYAFAASIFGVVIVASISYTIPRLGVTTTAILIVAGQIVIGLLLDHFGVLGVTVRPIDAVRVLGVVVIFVGIWLTLR